MGVDKVCEVFGVGVLEFIIVCFFYGIMVIINIICVCYLEIVLLILFYLVVIFDYFNIEVMIYCGYWMVSWFKCEFGLCEM